MPAPMESIPSVKADPPCVVAIVPTFGRPAEVEKLLRSVEASLQPVHAVILVDNGNDPKTREVAGRCAIQVEYLAPEENLGCGGGLNLGERKALELFSDRFTHFWILDDDAVISPACLGLLLEAIGAEHAKAACPLVVDQQGLVGWPPGLLDMRTRVGMKRKQTPEQFRETYGDKPLPFSWAQGIALLVTRQAILELGLHRNDYWVRGEDLEFSLRITHRSQGVFVPRAMVEHLTPTVATQSSSSREYQKHLAMLQNIAYTSLRLRHGLRIFWTVPSNWLRFMHTWHWRPKVLWDALTAFWAGAIRGKPAGAR